MYHYTYEITYQDGTKYIGVRSSKCHPIDDSSYQGSSKYTPNDKIVTKLILGLHSTRQLALKHEQYLQEYNDVVRNPMYHNRAIQTSTGFDTTGTKRPKFTKEHRERLAKASTGRVKTPEERAKLSASKTGKVNGPHSVATRKKISQSNKGKTFLGRTYTQKAYYSRLKFTSKYMWINVLTFQHLYLTPQELAHRLKVKVARFNILLKGSGYSCMDWSLVHLFVHKHHK